MQACADGFLATLTEGVVHGEYKVVTRSSFSVTQRHKVSGGKWTFRSHSRSKLLSRHLLQLYFSPICKILQMCLCHGRKSNLVEFQILPVESPMKEIWLLPWGPKSNKLGRQSNCSKSG